MVGLSEHRIVLIAVPTVAKIGGTSKRLALATSNVWLGPVDGQGRDGGVKEVDYAPVVDDARDKRAGEDAVRVIRSWGAVA
jgi:hypothetical protein